MKTRKITVIAVIFFAFAEINKIFDESD